MFFDCAIVPVHAQGFDWQYSARMPSGYPLSFIGITGSGNLFAQSGEINSVQGVLQCGIYKSGSGKGWNIGAHYEHWFQPRMAWQISLRYESFSGSFTTPADTEVRKDLPPVVREFELQSTLSYIGLDAGGKYRPFAFQKLFVGAGIQAGILVAHTDTQHERVVSPAEFRFSDGTQDHAVAQNNEIAGIQPFYVGARASVGLDLPLARSLYASPAVFFSAPVTSVAKDARWQRFMYGLQVTVLYGW